MGLCLVEPINERNSSKRHAVERLGGGSGSHNLDRQPKYGQSCHRRDSVVSGTLNDKTFEVGLLTLYLTNWRDLGLGFGGKERMKMISVKSRDEKMKLHIC